MRTRRTVIAAVILLFLLCASEVTEARTQSCEKVVRHLNARITPSIEERELVEVLRVLNRTQNKKLSVLLPNFQRHE